MQTSKIYFKLQIAIMIIAFLIIGQIVFGQSKTPTFPSKAKKEVSAKLQCTAITQKGEQCKRKQYEDNIYCFQHYNKATALNMKTKR